MDEVHFKIKSLDDSNYAQWVKDVRVILLERNCLDIIEGRESSQYPR